MKTRIKELRARYDLTQQELAKRVGVRRETIVFVEKGKYNPSLLLAYKIAQVLRANIEEIFIFDSKETGDLQVVEDDLPPEGISTEKSVRDLPEKTPIS